MNIGPAIVCGLFCGLGATGVVLFWPSPLGSSAQKLGDSRVTAAVRARLARIGMAGAVGVMVWLVTGWPVALPLGAVAAYGVPLLFGRTKGRVSLEKIEAIATWTEMLQSTLAASAGLGEAIMATAALSPPVIRGATARLAARLGSGTHPGEALLQYADELGDPCADRVVCALILAASSRAQRLGDLLAALAESTREEVALRLRVETSRASVRSSVRTVIVFSIVFALGLLVVGHNYLAPFGTGRGQLVLASVGVLYGTGLTLMASLARPPAPIRLLRSGATAR